MLGFLHPQKSQILHQPLQRRSFPECTSNLGAPSLANFPEKPELILGPSEGQVFRNAV